MKNLVMVFFVAFILALTGCSENNNKNIEPTQCTQSMKTPNMRPSLTGLEKDGLFMCKGFEPSIVVFKNELLFVTTEEGFGAVIFDFFTKKEVARAKDTSVYLSAYADENEIILISAYGKELKAMRSSDLQNWTEIHIIEIPEHQVFNSSLIKVNGKYVLAYEVPLSEGRGYTWRVSQGNSLEDLQNGTIGQNFSNEYSACPVIKYTADGYYQFIYLQGEEATDKVGGAMISKIARTKDFINYELSEKVFISPSGSEGRNASDVDLIEYQGKVYVFYVNGVQGDPDGWAGTMLATYNGTLEEMFNQIWEE